MELRRARNALGVAANRTSKSSSDNGKEEDIQNRQSA
jgi:hypothetical protein